MFLIIIGIIIAGYFFFKYCEGVGGAMEEYTNRPPEWNPPRPPVPPHPRSLEEIPAKTGCCCANCKYLYNGTVTEYWFDDNELKGKSETQARRNWCLRVNNSIAQGMGYRLHEKHGCGLYDPK